MTNPPCRDGRGRETTHTVCVRVLNQHAVCHWNRLLLPEPASSRSRKRKSPLKEGLLKASSAGRLLRPAASAMGKVLDLPHKHTAA